MASKVCKVCGKRAYSEYCVRHKPRKPIKVYKLPKKRGKRTIEYDKWRDTVAKPYLDKTFGHRCVDCGATEGLTVDHIKNRGSRADLKMKLSNVQYLCWQCHRGKTDRVGKYKENK